MNKELIDRAWACLPREFKEEVKKMHQKYIEYRDECEANHRRDSANAMAKIICLNTLFGYHNLTSDAEEEDEMLTVPRSAVIAEMNKLHKYSYQSPDLQLGLNTLTALFGSKCLPDDLSKNSSEIKRDLSKNSSEPKFKVGDWVKMPNGDVAVITEVDAPEVYNLVSVKKQGDSYVRWDGRRLEPYTEPKEDKAEAIADKAIKPVEEHFDTILKDGFSKERRLNIAAMAMQGLLNATSVERFTLRISPEAIAEAAFEYADALINMNKKGVTP